MKGAEKVLVRCSPPQENGAGARYCTEVGRAEESAEPDYRAANSLARARVKTRLLWVTVIVLGVGPLVIPVCLVMTMSRPEKVALMDGTESLIISSLVP